MVSLVSSMYVKGHFRFVYAKKTLSKWCTWQVDPIMDKNKSKLMNSINLTLEDSKKNYLHDHFPEGG